MVTLYVLRRCDVMTLVILGALYQCVPVATVLNETLLLLLVVVMVAVAVVEVAVATVCVVVEATHIWMWYGGIVVKVIPRHHRGDGDGELPKTWFKQL